MIGILEISTLQVDTYQKARLIRYISFVTKGTVPRFSTLIFKMNMRLSEIEWNSHVETCLITT